MESLISVNCCPYRGVRLQYACFVFHISNLPLTLALNPTLTPDPNPNPDPCGAFARRKTASSCLHGFKTVRVIYISHTIIRLVSALLLVFGHLYIYTWHICFCNYFPATAATVTADSGSAAATGAGPETSAGDAVAAEGGAGASQATGEGGGAEKEGGAAGTDPLPVSQVGVNGAVRRKR